MSTYTQLFYHIVFSTKNRERVITSQNRKMLLKYIWGIIKNKKSHLYRINAIEDHIHILTHIHPSIALSDFVKTIKISSSVWIKENNVFQDFQHWQDGYGAFTCSINDKTRLIEYIVKQEEHHKRMTFMDEYKMLLKEAGIKFEEKYLQ
jgi:putative transposase